ncbi:cisplatin damage response ATP-dependent DNA ligase [Dongia soli]|uniref:DNA ligase (ATP) n=1 Tax=Dongia soli TaxID=600628 RepID=A0ABU5EAC4_9PROT|nr:cisplatin damage response ATP-dependent DNA ligase [Dongia soli]MDY0882945.1 cisplatin damage response ATP-dependent DNA ligase [Dongia soli]
MQHFANLLDALSFQPARNAKLRLIETYLRTTPDPDRGYALAALTGSLNLPNAKPAILRKLGTDQLDETLFALSYDYVGDLAETLALIWQPTNRRNQPSPSLREVIEKLETATSAEVPLLLTDWLDLLDATGRWALLKLITGSLRVGVSARLAKTAVANFGAVALEDVEEIWHGLQPPYRELFSWLSGFGEKPDRLNLSFRPLMLAHPLDEEELAQLKPEEFRAEWKWDGIRVQAVAFAGERRLYSRAGEDISRAFPDIIEAMTYEGVLDGELLVARPAENSDVQIAPFNELQQRLNRKTITSRMLADWRAHVRLYDILIDGEVDLRPLPFDMRRQHLEDWYRRERRPRFDLSPVLPFASWEELAALRAGARAASIEGLMLKRADSPYLGGRIKGRWFKWKRDPLTVDAVLMYAQRGHGKRSSFYSDFTFGCWQGSEGEADRQLVPVGKAYSGYTDEELLQLDRWVRNHTINRFGPVREVSPGLVVELAFDAVQRSSRHKSGVALRFPRIRRLRWDKPAQEADSLDTLVQLISTSKAS